MNLQQRVLFQHVTLGSRDFDWILSIKVANLMLKHNIFGEGLH
ncbi:hypothetical protein [Wolbachia endosymbiont of Ctenocephalides felis wCfeJ]|nr:hypothetical protein [Wolbachia endosymbiont of Ctenocephalides felis wCfeJ]